MNFRDLFSFFGGNQEKGSGAGRSETVSERNMRLYGVQETDNFDVAAPAIPLNEQQMRHLATGGLLLFAWWLPLKQIVPVLPHARQSILDMLSRDWGVETGTELEAMMQSLLQKGHRATLQPRLVQNESYWRAKFDAHDFLRPLPIRSVAAWDCGRVACLAYWGLLVGLLNQETAFAYLQKANSLAQQHLSSWEELAASYLAGLIMWNPDDEEGVSDFCSVAQLMLQDEQSVWRLIPWSGR